MASLSSFPVLHVCSSFTPRRRKSGLNRASVCQYFVHPLESSHCRRRKLHSLRLASSPRAGLDGLEADDARANEGQRVEAEESGLRDPVNPSKGRAAKKAQLLKPSVRAAVEAQSAFGKAAEYIRKKQLGAFDKDAPPLEDPVPPPEPPPGPLPEVEIIRGAMKDGAQQRADETIRAAWDGEGCGSGVRGNPSGGEDDPSSSSSSSSSEPMQEKTAGKPQLSGDKKVLSALKTAAKYKREKEGGGGIAAAAAPPQAATGAINGTPSTPLDFKAQQENSMLELSAAALKLKLKREAMAAAAEKIGKPKNDDKYVEVEIVTRDGVIKNRVRLQDQGSMMSSVRDPTRKGVSSVDFKGLDFADKRQVSGPPPGLRETFTPAPTEELPEVEIITRSASQGIQEAPASDSAEGEDLYKPKVSTWGVFPRPQNISQTFGGGKNIQPGQMLETEEEKAQREAKTRRLLEEYRRKAGLDISPKVLAACNKAMKTGKALMDTGRLSDALPFFEEIMRQTVFNSELHGLAALQKAVCLDSMARSDEARKLYEKLANHTNGGVRKKASQMLFGFQAARKLKLEGRYKFDTGLYTRYFSAFSDGYNTMYKASPEEAESSILMQALPYFAFLLFPLVLVAYIALTRGN